MEACAKCCQTESLIEVSGRDGRMAFLKEQFKATTEGQDDRREGLADRIMDEIDRDYYYVCENCLSCQTCHVVDHLAWCVICESPTCLNCSIPALRLSKDGTLLEDSDNGDVICLRCSPPSMGVNADLLWSPSPEPIESNPVCFSH